LREYDLSLFCANIVVRSVVPGLYINLNIRLFLYWSALFLSKIVNIPSRTQGHPFVVSAPRHAFSIGRVGSAGLSPHSISHGDIVKRRPAFKDTKPLSHGLFKSTYLITAPQSSHPNRTLSIAPPIRAARIEPSQLSRPNVDPILGPRPRSNRSVAIS
jgi:hypothetical protein